MWSPARLQFYLWPTGALVLALLGVRVPTAAPPRVVVSAERQTATVGDQIKLTLSVDHRVGWQAPPHVPLRRLGEFDVLRDTAFIDRWREGDEGLRYVREMTLAAFKPGGFWIPAITGQTLDENGQPLEWRSDSLAITIASVLAEAGADTTDIKSLKGPYVAPVFAWYWWFIPMLAALLAALYLRYRLKKRRVSHMVLAPSIPAWEEALAQLTRLRQEVDPASDGGRLWYFRLSEILRRYWDGRYGWQSIDQTTSEIVRQLPQAPFDGDHRRRAEEFLHLADRVRYAKQPARDGRPEIDWQWLKTFVSATIPPRIVSSSAPPSEQREEEPGT